MPGSAKKIQNGRCCPLTVPCAFIVTFTFSFSFSFSFSFALGFFSESVSFIVAVAVAVAVAVTVAQKFVSIIQRRSALRYCTSIYYIFIFDVNNVSK